MKQFIQITSNYYHQSIMWCSFYLSDYRQSLTQNFGFLQFFMDFNCEIYYCFYLMNTIIVIVKCKLHYSQSCFIKVHYLLFCYCSMLYRKYHKQHQQLQQSHHLLYYQLNLCVYLSFNVKQATVQLGNRYHHVYCFLFLYRLLGWYYCCFVIILRYITRSVLRKYQFLRMVITMQQLYQSFYKLIGFTKQFAMWQYHFDLISNSKTQKVCVLFINH